MKRLTKSWEDNGDRYHCLSACEKECANDSRSSCFCDPIIKARLKLAKYEDTGLEPEEVAELAQAKADGRCVVLPCKVGDVVYRICGVKGKKHVGERYCHGVTILESGIIIHSTSNDWLGKTVFLTRAEAEAALTEKENNDERPHPAKEVQG